MVSPAGSDFCGFFNPRDLLFQDRQKGKIINIDDCQPAYSPGDNAHIERIKLDMPFQDILDPGSPVLVLLPVNAGSFLFIDRNQTVSVFQIMVYDAVNMIQNCSGQGPEKSKKIKQRLQPRPYLLPFNCI